MPFSLFSFFKMQLKCPSLYEIFLGTQSCLPPRPRSSRIALPAMYCTIGYSCPLLSLKCKLPEAMFYLFLNSQCLACAGQGSGGSSVSVYGPSKQINRGVRIDLKNKVHLLQFWRCLLRPKGQPRSCKNCRPNYLDCVLNWVRRFSINRNHRGWVYLAYFSIDLIPHPRTILLLHRLRISKSKDHNLVRH